jgi:putative ABC transport system permease protein
MTWRLSIRIARREAWRTRGRSLLVASMIALPVAGASAADTLWRSTQLTTAEQVARQMGRYDAVVDSPWGQPLLQSPDGIERTTEATPGPGLGPGPRPAPVDSNGTASGSDTSPSAVSPAAALTALLPPGSHVVPFMKNGIQAAVTKDRGRVWSDAVARDLTDPLQADMTRHRSGTPPTADDQAAVSTSELATLGKKVGDSIEVHTQDAAGPAVKTLRITGVYDNPEALDADIIYARPGVLTAKQDAAQFLVSVPGGVSWDLVKQLNKHGYAAASRQVLLHPPADSDVPLYAASSGFRGGGDTSGKAVAFAVAAIAVSMVLLEIILLAGPAFAVGARRRRRDFGLLGAAGADGKRLRRIVLADGLVLGAVGGVLGIGVGVLGSAAGYPWLSEFSSSEPGGFHIMPLELLAAGVVGVVTGLIAALAPAITTSRQHVLQALTGRRGETRTPWKLPVAGLVGVGLGSLLVFYGALRTGTHTLPIAAGIAIAELGVVACTPLLVSWSGHLARFLPLSGRLALRDGARNRGRTAPAVAAIMAAVAGASAIAMIVSTSDAKSRAEYTTELRAGEAGIGLGGMNLVGEEPFDAKQLTADVSAQLPTRQAAVQYGATYSRTMVYPEIERTAANKCPYTFHNQQDYVTHKVAYLADPRCNGGSGHVMHHLIAQPITAGSPELLRVLTGTDNPEAEDVLRKGGVVVFSPLDLATPAPNATVTIRGRTQGAPITVDGKTVFCDGVGPDGVLPQGCPPSSDKTVTLPAAVVPAPLQGGIAVVALHALEPVGVTFTPMNLLLDATRMPTAAEEQKADSAAAALGVRERLYVERGYQGGTMLGLLALAAVAGIVTLGAAAVATGLAITDAQSDLETLAAVGARPRVRRVLAGSQAAVTAALGAVLGSAFGLVPAIGLIETQVHGGPGALDQSGNRIADGPSYLTVPWLFLAVVILALPVLAALGASGLTKSRIEMRRRRA